MPYVILRLRCWLFAWLTSLCNSYKSEKVFFLVDKVKRESEEGVESTRIWDDFGRYYLYKEPATLLALPGL